MGFCIDGRDCKFGYGYEDGLDYITPFECQALNVTEKACDRISVNTSILSDKVLPYRKALGRFLTDSCLRLLDHQIVFDENKYYFVEIIVVTKARECGNLDKYVDNCPSYVDQMDHGMAIHLRVQKDGLPESANAVTKLLESVFDGSGCLSVEQEHKECQILINHREPRVITLKQLIVNILQVGQGKFPEYICPVAADSSTKRQVKPVRVSDGVKFEMFLTCLYTAFRKIEFKLQQAGYLEVFVPQKCGRQSLVNVGFNLKTAKDKYTEMNKGNIFEIYEVLKDLWAAYMDYLKFCFVHKVDLDEGEDLPGKLEELQPFLRVLNTWTPVKIGDIWVDCQNDCLYIPTSCAKVGHKIKATTAFKKINVVAVDSLIEPCLTKPPNMHLFGFVDMSGATAELDRTALPQLQLACPLECTAQDRAWICALCGEFVKVHVHKCKLICSCGSKGYIPALLECVNPDHEVQLKIDSLPNLTLKDIATRLRQYRNSNDADTNETIKNAIRTITDTRDRAELNTAINQMQFFRFLDEATKTLLRQYAAKYNKISK